MPAFNEQDAIAASLRSLLALDYPAGKLEIVAVNDGSTDDTLAEMRAVAAEAAAACTSSTSRATGASAPRWPPGIRATDAEIVAFVDSD